MIFGFLANQDIGFREMSFEKFNLGKTVFEKMEFGKMNIQEKEFLENEFWEIDNREN